ncbi:MAG: kinase [Jatrophihabitans sp.]
MTEPAAGPASIDDLPGTGRASAIAHHGEVLQGVFGQADGPPVAALVTLPFPLLCSTAVFAPHAGPELEVQPAWRVKARAAATAALRWLGHEHGGVLQVRSDIPVERGCGSSTADVVSSIQAVATALRRPLAAEDVARIAVAAEGAADGVMFGERAVLFANREGRVLEDLHGRLPPVQVLGLDLGAGVDTLALPPIRYSAAELDDFDALRSLLRRAVGEASTELLAQVAAASAEINQRHRPNPAFALATAICQRSGALGLQAAHSGTVLGLLYDPAAAGLPDQLTTAHALLREAGVGSVRDYRLPWPAGQQ